VRRFISAGAPLPLELARQWDEKFGLAINDGYGLTETCLATYNRDPRSKPGSVGTPLSGVQVRVVTETGELAPAGQLGEVLVQSPSTMLGYWNRPPDTAEMLQDSWFRTGDIGRLDGDGYLYIVDRIKDMINVGGVKVYSSEVENILYRHPAVREAAVYGVPEPVFGELVCANVVLRAGQNASAPDLIRFCHEHMAYFKVPSVVEFVEALPKGRSGKVLKRELRARMQGQLEQKLYGQPLLAEEASATEARIVERATRYFYPRTSEEYEVAYLWEELFGVAPIGLYDNFFDLGGNSLLALRLMIEIRQKFGKQFPLSVLLQYPTVEKFAGLLQSGEAKPWSALVPLNTKPAFFFLPGAGAIGPYLYPLAHALGDDQPFYTLESVGLDGVTPPHKTVEEDAAYFIEVIKQVQPHGPYYLGGHSHGGLQAFEMAQQLHKAGETVAALILVEAFPIQDTPVTFDQIAALVVKPDGEPAPVQQAPKATPEPPQAESQTAGVTDQAMNDIEMFVVMEKYYTEEYGAGLGLDNAFTAETLAPLTFEERLQKLKEAMDRVAAPQAANLMEVRGMVNVFIANLAIVYHPKDVAPIPITYFAGRDFGPEAIQWRKDGWEKYGPVELHIMPGGHTTGITEVPFVRETAREMADCLQRARDASQKMKAEG
jgi:thioesterase domain-containing protein/acyl carrier protein